MNVLTVIFGPLAFILAVVWIFFPLMLLERMKRQRKLLEEIRDAAQTAAWCAQKADRRQDVNEVKL